MYMMYNARVYICTVMVHMQYILAWEIDFLRDCLSDAQSSCRCWVEFSCTLNPQPAILRLDRAYSWIGHQAESRQRLNAKHLTYRLASFFDCSGMLRPWPFWNSGVPSYKFIPRKYRKTRSSKKLSSNLGLRRFWTRIRRRARISTSFFANLNANAAQSNDSKKEKVSRVPIDYLLMGLDGLLWYWKGVASINASKSQKRMFANSDWLTETIREYFSF